MAQLGVVFPQTELGADGHVVRAFAQAVEDMGYRHLQIYDHVLGADRRARPGWKGFDADSEFHEVFVLLGFLAAVTSQLELFTGILILPQRQTALVAKQAAEVDGLTGGRLRLGVGLGYNEVEYEALGMDFHNRGARFGGADRSAAAFLYRVIGVIRWALAPGGRCGDQSATGAAAHTDLDWGISSQRAASGCEARRRLSARDGYGGARRPGPERGGSRSSRFG